MYVYVMSEWSDTLAFVDVSDASRPVLAGVVQDLTGWNGAHAMAIFENQICIATAETSTEALVMLSIPTTTTTTTATTTATSTATTTDEFDGSSCCQISKA